MATKSPLVVMLEDDQDRLIRFSAVLSGHQFFHWRTAHEFIENFTTLPASPCLIALDHDLFVDNPNDPDPGDGRDVANYLAKHQPIAPVLIHSSNSIAADSMLFTLLESGWKAVRISPIGDDWIESDWFPTAIKAIRDARI